LALVYRRDTQKKIRSRGEKKKRTAERREGYKACPSKEEKLKKRMQRFRNKGPQKRRQMCYDLKQYTQRVKCGEEQTMVIFIIADFLQKEKKKPGQNGYGDRLQKYWGKNCTTLSKKLGNLQCADHR